jgi:hypothetical protein
MINKLIKLKQRRMISIKMARLKKWMKMEKAKKRWKRDL